MLFIVPHILLTPGTTTRDLDLSVLVPLLLLSGALVLGVAALVLYCLFASFLGIARRLFDDPRTALAHLDLPLLGLTAAA